MFLYEPVCVCDMLVLPYCVYSVWLSAAVASVGTEAAEPHGGQPCKEHKRPI